MLLQSAKKTSKFTNMVYVNFKYFLPQIRHPREIFLAGMLCLCYLKSLTVKILLQENAEIPEKLAFIKQRAYYKTCKGNVSAYLKE